MIYQDRIETLGAELKELKRRKAWAGTARLLTLALAVFLDWKLYPSGWEWAIGASLLALGGFLRLVIVSANLQKKIRLLEYMLEINREETAIARHDYLHRKNGASLLPAGHAYAHDLDLFGRASLFQYLQRTVSEQGDHTLAAWLLEPAPGEIILQRQEAVKELAANTSFRQEFQASGMLHPLAVSTEEKITDFLETPASSFTSSAWKIIRVAGPVIMCSLLLLNITDVLPNGPFYLAVLAALLFTGWISKQAMPLYLKLNRISSEMETLTDVLKRMEKEPFKSPFLKKLQHELQIAGTTASRSILGFRRILDRMDIRLNPLVFIPLNIFLFWDLQQLFALEAWKQQHPHGPSRWINAIAELEALNSLAALHANHPDWAFPELSAEHGVFLSSALGHPLIHSDKRVNSHFSTRGTPQISLVTGSNMAGKSTFLRSVGLNTVLAMAGAPVCAAALTVSNMRIMSSMRIADNLEESTSTFYAELKKLKVIITAVRNKEKVFLLLDEILRGTNSMDRHTGSAALIRQLIRENAVAIIATHDLELAGMNHISPAQLSNYHFDVQVKGEELYFDYALKNGVCTSLNASLLMKKIGIEGLDETRS